MIGLGVTLYSFNIEYYSYQRTFEDCLEAVGSLGQNQGVEIVAPMFDRGYPRLSYEFERRFKNGMEKHGLVPACWSGYADPQRFTGRFVTEQEQMDYIEKQIDSAAQLGFPILRIQPCKPFFKLVPYAEKKKVKLTFEVHAPMDLERLPYLETIVKMDTPFVGIVPDCGAFCRKPSELYYRRFASQGVSDGIAEKITQLWQNGYNQQEIRAAVHSDQANKELIDLMATESIEYFGRANPAALTRYARYIPHVHGKFFHMNESGEESAVRIPEIVAALKAGNFDGYIVSEYEGHHWQAKDDPLEQIRRHQACIRAY
jgi:hypothetical protein